MQIRLLLSFNAKVSNKIRSIVTGLGMRKGIFAVGAMLMLGGSYAGQRRRYNLCF